MRESFKSAHPLAQLVMLCLIGFGSMFVLFVVAMIPSMIAGDGINMLNNLGSVSDPNSESVFFLKILQIMQAIGLFLVPYLIYRWAAPERPYSLKWPSAQVGSLVLFSILMISALPAINLMAEWNSGLHLPGFLSGVEDWIYETEASAERLIRVFLTMETTGDLVFNLILIAFAPAIAEEAFFRGMMQPIFLRVSKNYHIAIWTTAFLFSFFHLQFLGFLPRMVLGIIFGYAAHWSGSLIIPMVGHFINNALAVLLIWMIGMERIESQVETLGANEGEWYLSIISIAVVAVGMVALYLRRSNKQKTAA